MSKRLRTHIITNAADLQHAINDAIAVSGRHPSEILIIGSPGVDRLSIEEDSLTDTSKVYNLVFHKSTAEQRKREASRADYDESAARRGRYPDSTKTGR